MGFSTGYEMESIREIFKIGRGLPAATQWPHQKPQTLRRGRGLPLFKVTLYGSLAATGRGHMTDVAVRDQLGEVNRNHMAA